MVIKERRERVGMTLETLAHKARCSKATLSQIENGKPIEKTSFVTVMSIAKILGIDSASLVDLSKINSEVKIPTNNIRAIPILDYASAHRHSIAVDDFKDGSFMPAIPVQGELAENLSPNGYALIIQGADMLPEFREGDQVIIDPDAKLSPGDIVIAQINAEEHAILRKYRPRGTDELGEVIELVPSNDDYPTILIDKQRPGEVLGVVVRHIRDPRRK